MRLTREEKTASAKAQKNMTMDGFEGWKVSTQQYSKTLVPKESMHGLPELVTSRVELMGGQPSWGFVEWN